MTGGGGAVDVVGLSALQAGQGKEGLREEGAGCLIVFVTKRAPGAGRPQHRLF